MFLFSIPYISTHDLARRSTILTFFLYFWQLHFNSRPRKEVDPILLLTYYDMFVFQLTTSQGGRLRLSLDLLALQNNFNSRPRKEVDNVVQRHKYIYNSFQLTTSQGGRRWMIAFFCALIWFQLTTSQGGRRLLMGRKAGALAFQLTTSQGGRPLFTSESFTIGVFQLTTSQGGRQQFLRKKFSFQNHFLCSLHIIYSYYINIVFFSTLFLAKSSFFLVRIH